MAKNGQIITFYSYKGGTGRTMAVANTACVLARRLVQNSPSPAGPRVLAIDWDFEAPGLHRYFLPYLPANLREHLDLLPGSIDLLEAIRQRRSEFGKDSFRNRATARSILQSIEFDNYIIGTTVPGLAIIKSGRHDANYARLVNAFDWEDFFYATEGFFPGLADFLASRFDYVLIDSRTGVTDTSGICTMLLPDKLVVPFTTNSQSLSGIEDVVRRAVNYRRQSEDWRPLAVFPLPSRIDISRPALAELWRNGSASGSGTTDLAAAGTEGYQVVFERLLAELYGPDSGRLSKYFDEVVLQHVPDYAYGEPIAVELETTDSRIFLRRSYENFVDRLTELSGPWESLEASRRDRELAVHIAEARERLATAIEQKDTKASEELLRLGFGLVEGQIGAANIEDMIDVVLAIAAFGIRGNTTAAALLATSVLDHAERFAAEDWRIHETALQQAAALFDDAAIHDKAEPCRRQHLALLRRELEPDNPVIIAAMQQLALTLRARGNLPEARALLQQVVEARRRVLGDRNQETLSSINVLAAVMQSQGDTDGARTLREQVAGLGRTATGVAAIREQATRQVRVFVSSPADVAAERSAVTRVIERLNREFEGDVALLPITWETALYSADQTFQDQVIGPAEADIAIFILWKRLGVPLPPERFVRADKTPYASGVEYEFEAAIQSAEARGTPDIYVFRKTARIYLDDSAGPDDQAQLLALDAFWSRWFRSETPSFTRAYHGFESTSAFEAQVTLAIRSWIETNVPLARRGATWPIDRNGSPFRGLLPFEMFHAPVFFGRRREIDSLRARLLQLHQRGCPFLLVIGASGSGKTSLLQAGLIPRLLLPDAVPDIDLWHRAMVVRPRGLGEDIARGFASALVETLTEQPDRAAPTVETLAYLLRYEPANAADFVRSALTHAGNRNDEPSSSRRTAWRLILVIDQLEEIFALPAAKRETLINALDVLVRGHCVWCIAALRSDAYGALLNSGPKLVRLKDDGGQFDLLPPGEAQIQEIIQRPARAAGVSFAVDQATGQSVDELLLHEAGRPGALPLLEFTLDRLFQSRTANNEITLAAYNQIGGLGGALGHVAEQVLTGVTSAAQDALPKLLFALARASADDTEMMTLREADLDMVATAQPQRELVNALIDARLLVINATGASGSLRTTVRLAHEALLTHWPRARDIVEHNGELYRIERRLAAYAAYWQQENRSSDFLLPPGRPLEEARRLLIAAGDLLPPGIRDFIERSLKRRQIHSRSIAGLAVVVTLLVTMAAYSGYQALLGRRQALVNLDLAADATGSLASLARVAAGTEAASLVARALAVAQSLARLHPTDAAVQDHVRQLQQACDAIKCQAR